jgi:hypothetical protein
MNTQHQISTNTRTSLFALTALAAVATTALAPISASAAWGPGGVYGRTPGNNNGGGFGGKPNGAVMHPGPCVPGATNCGSGGGQAGHPGGWTPGGQTGHPGGWTPGSQAGRAPWNPSGPGGYRPSGGRWDSGWRPSYGNNGYWHRPGSYWYGRNTYTTVPVQTYVPAPVQTLETYAPAPAQTTYAPAYPAPVQPLANQNCNCLSKSYMPDGTVVFADNCSNETATAAPGGAPQGQAGYQPH